MKELILHQEDSTLPLRIKDVLKEPRINLFIEVEGA
jgi:hypothetical protein